MGAGASRLVLNRITRPSRRHEIVSTFYTSNNAQFNQEKLCEDASHVLQGILYLSRSEILHVCNVEQSYQIIQLNF